MTYHDPVLKDESINALMITPGSIHVDATFGGGGHSRAILERLDENRRSKFHESKEEAEPGDQTSSTSSLLDPGMGIDIIPNTDNKYVTSRLKTKRDPVVTRQSFDNHCTGSATALVVCRQSDTAETSEDHDNLLAEPVTWMNAYVLLLM